MRGGDAGRGAGLNRGGGSGIGRKELGTSWHAEDPSGHFGDDDDAEGDERDRGQECAEECIGGLGMGNHRALCQPTPQYHDQRDSKQQTAASDDEEDRGDDADDPKRFGGRHAADSNSSRSEVVL